LFFLFDCKAELTPFFNENSSMPKIQVHQRLSLARCAWHRLCNEPSGRFIMSPGGRRSPAKRSGLLSRKAGVAIGLSALAAITAGSILSYRIYAAERAGADAPPPYQVAAAVDNSDSDQVSEPQDQRSGATASAAPSETDATPPAADAAANESTGATPPSVPPVITAHPVRLAALPQTNHAAS